MGGRARKHAHSQGRGIAGGSQRQREGREPDALVTPPLDGNVATTEVNCGCLACPSEAHPLITGSREKRDKETFRRRGRTEVAWAEEGAPMLGEERQRHLRRSVEKGREYWPRKAKRRGVLPRRLLITGSCAVSQLEVLVEEAGCERATVGLWGMACPRFLSAARFHRRPAGPLPHPWGRFQETGPWRETEKGCLSHC
jgi:hypothetical protein